MGGVDVREARTGEAKVPPPWLAPPRLDFNSILTLIISNDCNTSFHGNADKDPRSNWSWKWEQTDFKTSSVQCPKALNTLLGRRFSASSPLGIQPQPCSSSYDGCTCYSQSHTNAIDGRDHAFGAIQSSLPLSSTIPETSSVAEQNNVGDANNLRENVEDDELEEGQIPGEMAEEDDEDLTDLINNECGQVSDVCQSKVHHFDYDYGIALQNSVFFPQKTPLPKISESKKKPSKSKKRRRNQKQKTTKGVRGSNQLPQKRKCGDSKGTLKTLENTDEKLTQEAVKPNVEKNTKSLRGSNQLPQKRKCEDWKGTLKTLETADEKLTQEAVKPNVENDENTTAKELKSNKEYTSGPHKEWNVEVENPDLDISIVALDIQAGTGGASASGVASSDNQYSSYAKQASCSIFEYEDEDDMYIARTMYAEEDKEEDLSLMGTKKFPEPKILGNDPNSNQQVFLKCGPFGNYVQLGDDTKGFTPKRANVSQIKDISAITLEDALDMLRYPVNLGKHPEDKELVELRRTKTGFVIRHRNFISMVPKDVDHQRITLDMAVRFLKSKDTKKTGRPSHGKSKPRGRKPKRTEY